ncbi:MAG: hypothetical protein KME26_11535 [Oscillatoria princeps RMCB-10]|nr:hypothetical protein [Oscillatoria princeps RMCB-10]
MAAGVGSRGRFIRRGLPVSKDTGKTRPHTAGRVHLGRGGFTPDVCCKSWMSVNPPPQQHRLAWVVVLFVVIWRQGEGRPAPRRLSKSDFLENLLDLPGSCVIIEKARLRGQKGKCAGGAKAQLQTVTVPVRA